MIEQIGRYEIIEKIGEGGFAIVYRGRDVELDRSVALKELRPMLSSDENWVKRFQHEAKTIARLDHPHIVTVHDVHQTNGRLFIVMRLVEGNSLDKLIASRKGLDWGKAVEIFNSVASGLDYAHRKGTLHRDMKPANILLDPERGAMLSDFGLAKVTLDSSMSASVTGTVVGTPHYIAPEVWEGKTFTPQADIYALGCILYEIILGEPAFRGDTPPAVMMAHFKPPQFPRRWPKGVPTQVADVLMKAFAKTPHERYQTASEFAETVTSLSTDHEIELPFTPQRELAGLYEVQSPDQPSPPSENDSLLEPGVTTVLSVQPETVQTVKAETTQADLDKNSPPELAQSHQQLLERVSMLEKTLEKQASTDDLDPKSRQELLSAATELLRSRQLTPKQKIFSCVGSSAILIIGLAVILLFGVNTICAWANSIVAQVISPVELGETVTQSILVPIPDIEDTSRVEIDFSVGDLTISPMNNSELLIEGSSQYNASELKPKLDLVDNHVNLGLQREIGLAGYTTSGLINEWDLQLNDTPMALILRTNGVDSSLELGGLALTELEISHDIASMELSFSEPNQRTMKRFRFSGGASEADLFQLANSRAKRAEFNIGASSYTFDFTGDLQNDMEVFIEGSFSQVTIVVPSDVPAQLTLDRETIEVSMGGNWQNVSNVAYEQSGEGYSITFNIGLKSGLIQLEN